MNFMQTEMQRHKCEKSYSSPRGGEKDALEAGDKHIHTHYDR